jgi:F-type H+-transporting ATPase subunit alpha
VRAVLQQPQYAPIPATEQIAVLVAVNGGVFDEMPVERVAAAESKIRRGVRQSLPDLCAAIERGEKLSDGDLDRILSAARESLGTQTAGGPDGNG